MFIFILFLGLYLFRYWYSETEPHKISPTLLKKYLFWLNIGSSKKPTIILILSLKALSTNRFMSNMQRFVRWILVTLKVMPSIFARFSWDQLLDSQIILHRQKQMGNTRCSFGTIRWMYRDLLAQISEVLSYWEIKTVLAWWSDSPSFIILFTVKYLWPNPSEYFQELHV